MSVGGCTFFLSARKKVPKKELVAAPCAISVSALARTVITAHAEATFFRLCTAITLCFLFTLANSFGEKAGRIDSLRAGRGLLDFAEARGKREQTVGQKITSLWFCLLGRWGLERKSLLQASILGTLLPQSTWPTRGQERD